jgi:ATP-dependent Clp protease ATP-binding subunit ClpA
VSALSHNLHHSIRRALGIASGQHYRHATAEHLLLALADDPDAARTMIACKVDLRKLRGEISMFLLRRSDPGRIQRAITRPRPDARFQIIIQRAICHIRVVPPGRINGAHVLVQIFTDPAARFLQSQGMTRYDAASYVCHRVVEQEERERQTTPTSDTTSGAIDDDSYYEVRLLNDIYTPTSLGIQILQETFSVSYVAAVNMMLSAARVAFTDGLQLRS